MPIFRSRTQIVLAGLPFLVMGAVALAAVLAGPGMGILPLLALGPAFAAVSGGLRNTIIIGGVALLICGILATTENLLATRQDILAFATVSGVTAAGVLASAVRRRHEQELVEVRAIAEVAQHVLLRPAPPEMGQLQIAAQYVSATSRAQIGGDLYEVMSTADGVRLILGDVQGKGLPAVQTAATVLGTFREVAYDAADLETITDRLESSLSRLLADEEFVTAILAQVSADGTKVQLLNCGHPPPLLVSGTAARLVEPPGDSLPLGLAHLADVPRDQLTIPFGPGDRLLFYTDGVSEARDSRGQFYPLQSRGAAVGELDPAAALRRLRGDLVRHVGHALDDDAAMLLIGRPTG